MQSPPDFLQFLLRQSNSGALPFGASPGGDPLGTSSLASSVAAAPSLQTPGDVPTAFAPGDLRPFQPNSPFRSPDSDFMAESSGGILGGYPNATGNVPGSSRPAGILYTYNDPERRQDDRSRGQFFDPLRLDPFGANGSSIVGAPLSNFLTRTGSKRTDIYLKNEFGRPIAIYDLKTGNAQLTPARIQELRDAVGVGDIPVIELRWADLTALQR